MAATSSLSLPTVVQHVLFDLSVKRFPVLSVTAEKD
jgi:hypothetical protein